MLNIQLEDFLNTIDVFDVYDGFGCFSVTAVSIQQPLWDYMYIISTVISRTRTYEFANPPGRGNKNCATVVVI